MCEQNESGRLTWFNHTVTVLYCVDSEDAVLTAPARPRIRLEVFASALPYPCTLP